MQRSKPTTASKPQAKTTYVTQARTAATHNAQNLQIGQNTRNGTLPPHASVIAQAYHAARGMQLQPVYHNQYQYQSGYKPFSVQPQPRYPAKQHSSYKALDPRPRPASHAQGGVGGWAGKLAGGQQHHGGPSFCVDQQTKMDHTISADTAMPFYKDALAKLRDVDVVMRSPTIDDMDLDIPEERPVVVNIAWGYPMYGKIPEEERMEVDIPEKDFMDIDDPKQMGNTQCEYVAASSHTDLQLANAALTHLQALPITFPECSPDWVAPYQSGVQDDSRYLQPSPATEVNGVLTLSLSQSSDSLDLRDFSTSKPIDLVADGVKNPLDTVLPSLLPPAPFPPSTESINSNKVIPVHAEVQGTLLVDIGRPSVDTGLPLTLALQHTERLHPVTNNGICNSQIIARVECGDRGTASIQYVDQTNPDLQCAGQAAGGVICSEQVAGNVAAAQFTDHVESGDQVTNNIDHPGPALVNVEFTSHATANVESTAHDVQYTNSATANVDYTAQFTTNADVNCANPVNATAIATANRKCIADVTNDLEWSVTDVLEAVQKKSFKDSRRHIKDTRGIRKIKSTTPRTRLFDLHSDSSNKKNKLGRKKSGVLIGVTNVLDASDKPPCRIRSYPRLFDPSDKPINDSASLGAPSTADVIASTIIAESVNAMPSSTSLQSSTPTPLPVLTSPLDDAKLLPALSPDIRPTLHRRRSHAVKFVAKNTDFPGAFPVDQDKTTWSSASLSSRLSRLVFSW